MQQARNTWCNIPTLEKHHREFDSKGQRSAKEKRLRNDIEIGSVRPDKQTTETIASKNAQTQQANEQGVEQKAKVLQGYPKEEVIEQQRNQSAKIQCLQGQRFLCFFIKTPI